MLNHVLPIYEQQLYNINKRKRKQKQKTVKKKLEKNRNLPLGALEVDVANAVEIKGVANWGSEIVDNVVDWASTEGATGGHTVFVIQYFVYVLKKRNRKK